MERSAFGSYSRELQVLHDREMALIACLEAAPPRLPRERAASYMNRLGVWRSELQTRAIYCLRSLMLFSGDMLKEISGSPTRLEYVLLLEARIPRAFPRLADPTAHVAFFVQAIQKMQDYGWSTLRLEVEEEIATIYVALQRQPSHFLVEPPKENHLGKELPKCSDNGSGQKTSPRRPLDFGAGCFFLWGRSFDLRGKPLNYLKRIWGGYQHRLNARGLLDETDYPASDDTLKSQLSQARRALTAAIKTFLPDYADDPLPCIDGSPYLAYAILLPALPGPESTENLSLVNRH